MGITIQARNDVSALFSSLGSSNSSSGTANMNFLSEYASIKNGSYGKLMRAYYSQDTNSKVSSLANSIVNKKTTASSTSTATDSAKELAAVQSATDNLKESANALLESGKKSVFTGDTMTDKAYDAVSRFVKDYNDTLASTKDINSSSILNRTATMTGATASNEKMLAGLGITVNEDKTLSLDKDTFMNADVSTAKNLFNGTGSYAYQVSSQASFINFSADNEAAKANTYTATGTYGNNYNTGNIFTDMF